MPSWPKRPGGLKPGTGEILVPFAAESALSGVGKPVGGDKALWYRRTFDVPKTWRDGRVLLHFGAVDWESTVWINGREAGTHRGGYDPFTYDITGALKRGAKQEVVLRVYDPTDEAEQRHRPRETGHEAARHLLYGRHGHLADGLARTRPRNPYLGADDHARHRSRDAHGPPVGRRRPRGSDDWR